MSTAGTGGVPPLDWDQLTPALRLWSGIDHAEAPIDDMDAVHDKFGPEAGRRLGAEIRSVVRAFNESDAFSVGPQLMGMTAAADFYIAGFRAPGGAIQVLVWQYLWLHEDSYSRIT